MQMLMKMKKNLEIAQTIDEAINEYYSLQGRDVPNWKRNNPKWWTDYLNSLGMDPNNK